MREFAKAFAELLKAPAPVWRMCVGLFILGFAYHVAWACGWIPRMSGFALAAELEKTDAEVALLKKELDCANIDQEIKRIRAELRDNETKMFEAQQESNQPLIGHLRTVLSDIGDELDDVLLKRLQTQCP